MFFYDSYYTTTGFVAVAVVCTATATENDVAHSIPNSTTKNKSLNAIENVRIVT